MMYFDLNCVRDAYNNFQGKLTNKSWGLLCVMKQLAGTIVPLKTYTFNSKSLSEYIENLFCLSTGKTTYKDNAWFVKFSPQWHEFFKQQNKNKTKEKPNIFDAIVWAYRKEPMTTIPSDEDLINKFAKDFHIENSLISSIFDITPRKLSYDTKLYTETALKTAIPITSPSNNITAQKDKKETSESSVGELKRGPFTQPLYGSMDTHAFFLISEVDFDTIYTFNGKKASNPSVINLPLQQIFYGAPGTGKSNTIKREVDEKGRVCIRTTFHPDSDYSTFVGCYKPTMKPADRIYNVAELIVELDKIKRSGVTYPCQKFGAKYWRSLQYISPSNKKLILTKCGYTDTMGTEVDKGSAIGQEYLDVNDKIEYAFVKQAFLKAYLKAWKNYTDTTIVATTATATTPTPVASPTAPIEGDDREQTMPENPNLNEKDSISETKSIVTPSYNPVFLIIEEINRGNCAQIFGDIFQLLDRQNNGFSEYPIEVDCDIQKAIEDAFNNDPEYKLPSGFNIDNVVKGYTSNYGKTLSEDVKEGRVMLLPANLYIWATMNTSDQSLFPIDSAFKRRWDWKYIKITNAYQKDEKGNFILNAKNEKIPLNWKLSIEHDVVDTTGSKTKEKYDWWLFLQKINSIIDSMTSSADKQLGYFFCKADDNGIISEETFVSKVLFYLWNDVFKDYGFEDTSLFRFKDEKGEDQDLTFPDFYNEDGDKVNTERVADFVKNVMIWNKKTEEKD